MGKQDNVAQLVYLVQQDNIGLGQCCVVTEGVFFFDRRLAEIFAKKHDKELKRVDSVLSGWLAANKD